MVQRPLLPRRTISGLREPAVRDLAEQRSWKRPETSASEISQTLRWSARNEIADTLIRTSPQTAPKERSGLQNNTSGAEHGKTQQLIHHPRNPLTSYVVWPRGNNRPFCRPPHCDLRCRDECKITYVLAAGKLLASKLSVTNRTMTIALSF